MSHRRPSRLEQEKNFHDWNLFLSTLVFLIFSAEGIFDFGMIPLDSPDAILAILVAISAWWSSQRSLSLGKRIEEKHRHR
ncbi:hypothetical protein LRY65_02900 [Candidatus Woesebacteria bacterium]|nr:hypothetical protein [Candidatus Woesebacteria bacterium]MCD8507717.1 hypothetical protein [Candidatus Woesebacteria bacterium]MCD8527139.1 hypothetical protein [Candidatus Woesebacteria bacterium]MCD8546824.1 hypothetical protein [Candidatus Woesebacteria bacterium]